MLVNSQKVIPLASLIKTKPAINRRAHLQSTLEWISCLFAFCITHLLALCSHHSLCMGHDSLCILVSFITVCYASGLVHAMVLNSQQVSPCLHILQSSSKLSTILASSCAEQAIACVITRHAAFQALHAYVMLLPVELKYTSLMLALTTWSETHQACILEPTLCSSLIINCAVLACDFETCHYGVVYASNMQTLPFVKFCSKGQEI